MIEEYYYFMQYLHNSCENIHMCVEISLKNCTNFDSQQLITVMLISIKYGKHFLNLIIINYYIDSNQ